MTCRSMRLVTIQCAEKSRERDESNRKGIQRVHGECDGVSTPKWRVAIDGNAVHRLMLWR